MRRLAYLLLGVVLSLFLMSCGSIADEGAADKISLDTTPSDTTLSDTTLSDTTSSGTKDFSGVDELTVHYMDVGQGDCTLVVCGGEAMLIDAGGNDKGMLIRTYLRKQGIDTLKYAVGTHPDADHIGGLDVIIYNLECENIFLADYKKNTKTCDDVYQAIKSKSYQYSCPKQGDTYALGDAVITIVAPAGADYGDNANNYSIGIKITHGDNTFLFTGDAEEEAEEDMRRSGADLKADVFQAGHHGSRTSNTENFLEKVNPEYVVISCGEDNSYGHPHAGTLNTLRSMGVKVFRTDEQGTIVALSDGKNITWNCSPSESWQAGESAD